MYLVGHRLHPLPSMEGSNAFSHGLVGQLLKLAVYVVKLVIHIRIGHINNNQSSWLNLVLGHIDQITQANLLEDEFFCVQ